jgi:hypothetical protein
MQVIPPKGLWRRAYRVDFRTQAARDFLADQTDYTDSAGAVWSVENHGAAGATFGIGAAGLTIVGTAGTNVTGSTRTAPLLRTPVSGLGFASERYILHTAMDLVVTTPASNTGALVLFEAASGNNNSRNYIGDSMSRVSPSTRTRNRMRHRPRKNGLISERIRSFPPRRHYKRTIPHT